MPPTTSVASMIRDQIQSGNYKEGEWLPTERALSEDLGVDRRVVRMAINQLVESGLVIRRPHCRPVVGRLEVEPVKALSRDQASSDFIALLMCHGSEKNERSFNSQQRIFWGMNQALSAAGYHAVFLDLEVVASEQENAAREAEQLRYLLKRGFGGAVFYPYAYRSNRELLQEVAAAIPLVTIDRQIDSVDTDFVGVDNHKAMYDVVQHLIAQGHRRIAYVTKNEPIRAVQDRIMGYIDATSDADILEMVLPIPSRDTEQEWIAVDTILQLPEGRRPTAVVAFNDYTAMNLVGRLEAAGLSVPGDIALTGFDDIISALPNGVGLTTVAQPYEEIGRKAVELLLLRLSDRSAPSRLIELPAHLAVRESSYGSQPAPLEKLR
ncbi:GntR family transcriptional regulator [Capsulimonas corticalis]|nr:GntR family transcriptional regulator [Capsulimonas corticalis]